MSTVQFFNGFDWDNRPAVETVQLVNVEVAMKAIDEGMAEVGLSYPVEFVGTMADNAIDTLEVWLEVNAKPLEVVDLVHVAILLTRSEEQQRAGTLSEHDAAQLPGHIADATRLIALLGGVFHSGNSQSIAREPIKAE